MFSGPLSKRSRAFPARFPRFHTHKPFHPSFSFLFATSATLGKGLRFLLFPMVNESATESTCRRSFFFLSSQLKPDDATVSLSILAVDSDAGFYAPPSSSSIGSPTTNHLSLSPPSLQDRITLLFLLLLWISPPSLHNNSGHFLFAPCRR